jgi:hypothetical protein
LNLDDEADERVNRLVLKLYQKEKNFRDPVRAHLQQCPEIEISYASGEDGSYGCDTGCEYVRLEATLKCHHDFSETYHYGSFGDLAILLEDLD